jgi:DNA-directed RNA polymerase subunit RPC12/RpoP
MAIKLPVFLTADKITPIVDKIILNKDLSQDEEWTYQFYHEGSQRCSTCRKPVGFNLDGDRDERYNWLDFWVLNEPGDEIACPLCGPDEEE